MTAYRKAIPQTPVDDRDHAMHLSNLAGALWIRSRMTGSADLDEAIDHLKTAAATLPHDHERRVEVLADLGNALQERFAKSGAPADVDNAVAALTEAASLPADDQEREALAADVSLSLASRYRMLARAATGGARAGSGTNSVIGLAGGVRGCEDASAEEVEVGAAVHLPLDHLDAVDVSFDGAGAVGQAESVGDGGEVALDAAGEGAGREVVGLDAVRSIVEGRVVR